MTKIAAMLAALIALATSAHAQQRVFVSSTGLDTNPCTVAQPCRTFQVAHNVAANNGEIDVLDPAGYGPLTITKGISIQGHGFSGITQTCSGCVAIAISVTTSDPVSINGLLIDGGGTGGFGINITSGPSVLNSVVRHFQTEGIMDGRTTIGSNLLIEDTTASDNAFAGITVEPGGVKATLNRITANHNQFGVGIAGSTSDVTIANSVLSNNSNIGMATANGAVVWLSKTVISGNTTGVSTAQGGTVNSYGDNYIRDNTTPVSGSLTPVTTQ
jgi:Right handed beta helix region